MTLSQSVKSCFQKYFVFSGRVARSEFWKFVLFIFIVLILATIVHSVIFGPTVTYEYRADLEGNPIGDPIGINKRYHDGIFGDLFLLACLFPWLAVTWRRMHDAGKPGFLPFATLITWIVAGFLFFISVLGMEEFSSQMSATGHVRIENAGIGGLLLFVGFFAVIGLNLFWLTRPSQPGPNKYGPNPNEVHQ